MDILKLAEQSRAKQSKAEKARVATFAPSARSPCVLILTNLLLGKTRSLYSEFCLCVARVAFNLFSSLQPFTFSLAFNLCSLCSQSFCSYFYLCLSKQLKIRTQGTRCSTRAIEIKIKWKANVNSNCAYLLQLKWKANVNQKGVNLNKILK